MALTGAATATSEAPAATRTVAKLATIFLTKTDLLGLEFSHENERALGACAGSVRVVGSGQTLRSPGRGLVINLRGLRAASCRPAA